MNIDNLANTIPVKISNAVAILGVFVICTVFPQQLNAHKYAPAFDSIKSPFKSAEIQSSSTQSFFGTAVGESDESIKQIGRSAPNNGTQFLILAADHSTSSISKLPEISIVAESRQLTEGDDALFKILADSELQEDIIINVRVTQTGDFILWRAPKRVKIPAGNNSVGISIATDDDRRNEDDGMISISLESGEGYAMGSETTASVEIFDNDDESSAEASENPEISVAGAVIEKILAATNQPTITISAEENPELNGKDAVFTVSAHPVSNQDVLVNLLISRSGISTTDEVKSVILKANSNSMNIPVGVSDEGSEHITVSVEEGAGYGIGAPSSASISINE